ncbi:chemotaxis protein CheX [Endothiovibrio diazotrophicus]
MSAKKTQPKAQAFVQPAVEALVRILHTMAATEVTAGPPAVKENPRAKGSVTGIIPLRSSEYRGSLAVTFSKPAILAIYRRMVHEERESLDEEVANLAGEITNMVAGGANREYSEQGHGFEMATPFLLLGQNHAVHHDLKGTTLLIPFDSDVGGIFIELCFTD